MTSCSFKIISACAKEGLGFSSCSFKIISVRAKEGLGFSSPYSLRSASYQSIDRSFWACNYKRRAVTVILDIYTYSDN